MPSELTWFSQAFSLDKPQFELPFVDFVLERDVPLYIDPYAITSDPTSLGAECHNAIVSFFEELLLSVREGDTRRTRLLVTGRFREPNEIPLGVSQSARAGRGWGVIQETQIVQALIGSEALATGLIQNIQELELHIDHIGPDKVSDLVANIIKGLLGSWTEQVCSELSIATRPVATGPYWSEERSAWISGEFHLPVHLTDDGPHAYILVPKRFIRRERDLMNHYYFYRRFVLDILQQELLSANDSLVQTLKSGRRRVTKNSIQKDDRFKPRKSFISQFIREHPAAIEQYRREMETKFAPVDPAVFSEKSAIEDPKIRELLDRLDQIEPGRAGASDYHGCVFELLKFVFDYALVNWDIEYKMDLGLGRIDIMCDNRSNNGVFSETREILSAMSVPIECKNYSGDLSNEEFNQIEQRLGESTSRLGMIYCRSVQDRRSLANQVGVRWLRHKNCILVFDDRDVKTLSHLRLERDYEGIDNLVRARIRDVQFQSISS